MDKHRISTIFPFRKSAVALVIACNLLVWVGAVGYSRAGCNMPPLLSNADVKITDPTTSPIFFCEGDDSAKFTAEANHFPAYGTLEWSGDVGGSGRMSDVVAKSVGGPYTSTVTYNIDGTAENPGDCSDTDTVEFYIIKVDIVEMDFIDSVDGSGVAEDNNFDIANDAGTALLISGSGPEWTSAAGMVGETVYIRDRRIRANVKLKISPVVSGTPLELELYSTGDLDFTPSGTADKTVTLTFDASGYATHTFTTYTEKTVDHLERKKYDIDWQGFADTQVEQYIYTLYGEPVDNGPGTAAANRPRHNHLKYLLGPQIGGEGNWCHQKSTLKEKGADSIVYGVYTGIIADGTFNTNASPPVLADVWEVVTDDVDGGLCLEFAKLMKEALLVAGVPDSELAARSVISKEVRGSWLGGAGKTVLAGFKEDAGGLGTTWLNQGVCGVNTSDNGWRYYDLTGPGLGAWETGSGGWATPAQPNTPGPNNLWYEGLPTTVGPVIKLFTETYGQWHPAAGDPQDGETFWFLTAARSQMLITGTDPWAGDDITVHYRTEGVLNVGVKVEVTLYQVVGTGLVEVDVKEQAIVAKWGNSQQMTFTVPGNSGETFQFYARILKADDTTHANAWIDPGNPASVTTKP